MIREPTGPSGRPGPSAVPPVGPDDLGAVFREHTAPVIGALMRSLNDLALAEDAYQDACIAALEAWPRSGRPERPGAWLLTTARRRVIDRIRREGARATKELAALGLLQQQVGIDSGGGRTDPDHQWPEPLSGVDDRLRLLFTACHPVLPLDARVALTLRVVGGLRTEEIARAFLVSEETVAQRMVRARRKLTTVGYRVPSHDELPERLDGVLQVIYVVFSEGYSSSAGNDLIRTGLCDEAIRLGHLLHDLMSHGLTGEEAEVGGLLALMLLQDSRRDSRLDADGELVLLEDQDRSRWNHAQIVEGFGILHRSLRHHHIGPYQIEAAIAAVHAEAASFSETDWQEIAALYGRLVTLVDSPVVRLNEAVAIAMADGPAVGLHRLEALRGDPRIERMHLFHAAVADLHRRLGHLEDARAAYLTAASLVTGGPEQRFIERRLTELG